MKKYIAIFLIAFSFLSFTANYSTAAPSGNVIKEIGKKIGKFFSKKPVDKKTGKYIIGGAVVNDTINKKDNKK